MWSRSLRSPRTLAHQRIEVEDTAVAALRFKNGALGVIEAATSAYPGLLKRTEIHGDRGSARVEQDDLTLWEFQEKVPSDNEVYAAMAGQTGFKAGASDPRGITHIGHRDQLIDFLERDRHRPRARRRRPRGPQIGRDHPGYLPFGVDRAGRQSAARRVKLPGSVPVNNPERPHS